MGIFIHIYVMFPMQDAERIYSELLELKYPWKVDRVSLYSQKKVVEVFSRMKMVQSSHALNTGKAISTSLS